MKNDLVYQFAKPEPSLADFVDGFGMLYNTSNLDKNFIILPDGKIDLLFVQTSSGLLHCSLHGIETQFKEITITPGMRIFSIHFNLIAVECIFHNTISDLLNTAQYMPDGFWNITSDDLNNFEILCDKASKHILTLLSTDIDRRKQQLFYLIYSSNGSTSIQELSAKIFWSSRQISRYFKQQFGISLKAYCNILRFRASFKHISEGKLFPEQNFADQNHFIKNIKKYSGVTPKILSKDERFINITVSRNDVG